MHTLGIDLAAQDDNTAACVIAWDGRRATVETLEKGVDDDRLLAAMADADWTGIDAPFGWPDHFLDATTRFARDGTWPAEPAENHLRYRATDRALREARDLPNPLSVSSDRIAVPAWRCAGLLSEHARRTSWTVDRLGASGVAEVYPAAALARWGLDAKGYKRGGLGASRQAGVRPAAAREGWIHVPSVRATLGDLVQPATSRST